MYVILGLGIQGEAILRFLLENTEEKVLTFDIKNLQEKLHDLYNYHVRDKWKHWIITPHGTGWEEYIDSQTEKNIIVINCLPTEYNLAVTRTCLTRGWHLVDLGGVTSIVREQFGFAKEAEKSGLVIVPDCGLAPGVIASLAAEYDKDVEIYCGGIPKYPDPLLSYCKVFYTAGVIKEYSGVSYEIEDGEVVAYPTLSGRELIFIPSLGVLEAARTSGGVSISVDHLELRNYSYKTLRYPGHWDYVEKYIMPQKDPAQVLEDLIEPVSSDNPDIIILSIHINGGEEIREYFWDYDYRLDLPAMAQATGYVVAAVATMIADELINPGVRGMHEISAKEIITRARWMGDKQFSEAPFTFDE